MRNGTTARVARGFALIAAALVAQAPPATAHAAGAGADPIAGMRACTAVRDDTQRLACFDREIAALPADVRGAAPATPAAPPPSTATMTAEERFGYRGDVAREEHDRRRAEEEALEELQARVTQVAAQASGDFVITLDNGQVWTQIPVGRPARLKVDDRVTIRRAALGSFMLSAPTARGVRVRRVQ